MATATLPKLRRSIPEHSPLEAIPIACGGCGSILQPRSIMGRRGLETLKYECRNEEFGCSYEIERKVPVQNSVITGIRQDGTPVKL
jgi:hypothetical protein